LGEPKRVGQCEVPEVDLTLSSPIEGAKRLKGKGTFFPSINRVSYNVSLLNGDDEAVSIRGDAEEAKRISIFVPFGDANLWRKVVGESGVASACIFIVPAEAKARETFTNFVTKAKRKRSPSPGVGGEASVPKEACVPSALQHTPLR
jgi:hypothetical protein